VERPAAPQPAQPILQIAPVPDAGFVPSHQKFADLIRKITPRCVAMLPGYPIDMSPKLHFGWR